MFRKVSLAALGGLLAAFSFQSNASATGDLWVEGSYEILNLPDTNFINNYNLDGRAPFTRSLSDEFVNDDGDFDGFRIDAGISNIPLPNINGFAGGLKGFFAWHDGDQTDLICSGGPFPIVGLGGQGCNAVPLFDPDPNVTNVGVNILGDVHRYATTKDLNHWGLALEIVSQGPVGFRAGPAFRRIDQDLTVMGSVVSQDAGPDPFVLTYKEDLETNYWGGFIGVNQAVPLGGGWALLFDGEAGIYWADTDYSGSYVMTNGFVGVGVNPNVNQQLSLESDEAAFIGVVKIDLEKDFGTFKIGGFGRIEYISSAPDVAYNDFDRSSPANPNQRLVVGPDDGTRLGERFATSVSTGARITVPLGSDQ